VKKEQTKFDEFLGCLPASREYGFSDWCVVVHAWHESGGFQKVIGKYNFWGIKKPDRWAGEVLPINTHEFVGGKNVSIVDYFIDFATCEQAMLWYCDLIERLYPEAFFNRALPELFFKGLTNGKYQYATDPKYSDKLISLYNYLKSENDMLKNILK
jgi:flagellar protein FlgJ